MLWLFEFIYDLFLFLMWKPVLKIKELFFIDVRFFFDMWKNLSLYFFSFNCKSNLGCYFFRDYLAIKRLVYLHLIFVQGLPYCLLFSFVNLMVWRFFAVNILLDKYEIYKRNDVLSAFPVTFLLRLVIHLIYCIIQIILCTKVISVFGKKCFFPKL